MGSDEAKLEKKRLKSQVKAEKARAKIEQPPTNTDESPTQQAPLSEPEEEISWYKDPNWVRAIIAIVTLVVMVITLFVAL